MIILVVGVSGSGKTTVGELLAKALNWEFSDADQFHPKANIEKMSHAIPLNDVDRQPWLEAMQRAIDSWLQDDKNMVLACSALKASYRQMLLRDRQRMRLVYLKGSFEQIKQRMEHRPHHYMKVDLLRSQFDILEEPHEGIIVDISLSPEEIVQQIRVSLAI